jgi:hypothetical protein
MLMKVHGTYPFDMHDKWNSLGRISHEEAAKLVNAPEEVRQQQYMWLNKGFIVLGLPQDEGRTVIIEDMYFNVEHQRIKKGMQAVYLHDGNYTLLERVKD